MTIENDHDLKGILAAGKVVASTLQYMLGKIEVGMTTRELDFLGREYLEAQGAQSAPELVYGFPGATCISINEEAAHGVPGERKILAGDIVNVDVSAKYRGYFADTGGSIVVQLENEIKKRLCYAGKRALQEALKQVRAGGAINQVGKAVQNIARQHRFKVIKNLAGHGVGRGLHEQPDDILSFFNPHDRRSFKKGQVVAVEPFLSTHSTIVHEADDGWTLVGQQGNLSVQYEHTVIVTEGKPIIATAA